MTFQSDDWKKQNNFLWTQFFQNIFKSLTFWKFLKGSFGGGIRVDVYETPPLWPNKEMSAGKFNSDSPPIGETKFLTAIRYSISPWGTKDIKPLLARFAYVFILIFFSEFY